MRNCKTFCFGLAAAFVLASAPALAQVYSWRDPATGHGKISNIAPPWYSRGEAVSGPRVIATVGDRVIDDTALPYADRLLLSGKTKDQIDKLRPEQQHGSAAAAEPKREAAASRATGRRPADETATREPSSKNTGS